MTLLIISFVIGLGILMVSSNKFSKVQETAFVPPSYTCCDSGDGPACQPNPSKKIFYKGVKATAVEEYHLLKSNVYLRSQDHHIDPDPSGAVTDTGERIFYNPRSERNKLDWKPECFSNINSPGQQRYGYDDFIFGPGSPGLNANNDDYPDLGCYAIPNEQLVYVCRAENPPGECESQSGTARFDVYYRAADFAATGNDGIHDIIKNCVKPEVDAVGGDGTQQIVTPIIPEGQPNLQLRTFNVESNPPVIDWISPYCKPAVYLYPEKESEVMVKVVSEQKLTYTLPLYPAEGWKVRAYPNGDIISDGEHYDYLYYETEVDDQLLQLPDEGYSVSYAELPVFLPALVKELGLNVKESGQFSAYWMDVLPRAPYYRIKVITQERLDMLTQLMITPRPNSVIRITLHFEPREHDETLQTPIITSVKREGFTVVEWGGIFKKSKDYPFSCFM